MGIYPYLRACACYMRWPYTFYSIWPQPVEDGGMAPLLSCAQWPLPDIIDMRWSADFHTRSIGPIRRRPSEVIPHHNQNFYKYSGFPARLRVHSVHRPYCKLIWRAFLSLCLCTRLHYRPGCTCNHLCPSVDSWPVYAWCYKKILHYLFPPGGADTLDQPLEVSESPGSKIGSSGKH